MARQAKYALLLLVALFVLAVWLLWFRGYETWFAGARSWGHGELKVSERGYYMSHINATLVAARHPRWQADGLASVYLVIDTAKKAMWVESDGRIQEESYTDLPSTLDWTVHRSSPEGPSELAPLSRFRLPANPMQRRFLPEAVWLAGTRGKQESMYFQFSSTAGSCGYAKGPWSIQSIRWPSSSKQTVQDGSYESIIVSDADYEKTRAQFSASRSAPVEPAELRENKAAWRRAEKQLYQEIERQIRARGLQLWYLSLNHRPDYTAAFARLGAGYGGVRWILYGRSSVTQEWLRIDYLGNDLWYARNAQQPQRLTPIPPHLNLEFLVSVAGKVPKEHLADLLMEGRRRQQKDVQPSSKWQATLSNGAIVELVGVCENPSANKPWWGPDGSPLDDAPYMNYEQYEFPPGDRAMEIAWRAYAPQGGTCRTQRLLEEDSGSYYRQIDDPDGNPEGLEANAYAFDKSRTQTTLKIGVQVDSGPFVWTTFKNISLVPGKDSGFEIDAADEQETPKP